MLVIIHGWSDTGRSFGRLGRHLLDEGIVDAVRNIRLGDYISLDDDVTFDDLSEAMQEAWLDEKLPTGRRSVDVVIHSTGGLVVRHWMTQHFKASTNPIRRLLMLAPANFGSPLAHKGRSFIGRIAKGFKSDKPFETGTHILRGLELASPFAWNLAMKDRFGEETWYGPGKVLATVLVGTRGYSGISAAANEPGTDGTVRVATANLNSALVTLEFPVKPPAPAKSREPQLKFIEPRGITAFARIANENHSTIALKDGGPKEDITLPLIKRALQVTDATFEKLVADLEKRNEVTRGNDADKKDQHAYQDTVVRLTDSHGVDVRDYFLEIFGKKADGEVDDDFTRRIQEDVITTVHANDENAAYRSLHLDVTELSALTGGTRPIFVSLTAKPDLRETDSVGYRTLGFDDIDSIRLTPERLAKFIGPDRTVLVDIRIPREQEKSVFRFSKL